jgi:radical SAM superfamily enzyme YgiQ (UPF0313 family)
LIARHSIYYGTEPNAYRKPWNEAAVRWCLVASWPYEHAAGNQSIPAVYKAVNESETYLCDRFYLPATPRDLNLLERGGIPAFGIESKHQLRDFDVVGTSISYVVLFMNFAKMLTMSGIPLRWADRVPEEHPLIVVGGQSYCAPEPMAPVADCIFLGEAEDEPGNGGIGQVCRMIEMLKAEGLWNADRVECYRRLARTFNYLYFPRFVDVEYGLEDRRAVGAELPSRQVHGYSSNLSGMRMPFRKRHVIDLDKIKPLDNPPLLFTDPSLGAGDLETSRGCPAWCSFCRLCLGGETEFITSEGVRRLAECEGRTGEVWTDQGWAKATVAQHGYDVLNTITFAPACRGASAFAKTWVWKKTPTDFTVQHRATALHRWPLVDGTETHHLQAGDFVRAEFVRDEAVELGWLHGMVFGDGTHENFPAQGERSNTYAVLIRADRPDQLERFTRLECGQRRNHGDCVRSVCVTSAVRVTDKLYRVRMSSRIKLKQFPDEVCSSGYVRGFIEGWDAADGDTRWRSPDRRRIRSQRPGAEEWLRRTAAYGGWLLTGTRRSPEMETNYGRRRNPITAYALSRVTAWKVVSIEEGKEQEPVYCATVPGAGFWTLSTGVYTGNTFAQKPFRQRSVGYVTEFAKAFQRNVGGTELSPFGPDFPMQTNKKRMIKALLENVSDEVDAVAMRVDDFAADDQYVLLQAFGGSESITLGLEGNSQRMRDLVGKGTSEAEVRDAVTKGIRAGFRKFKLFMITNLPGEDSGDLAKIMQLARDLADIRDSMGAGKVRIQFSWTPLLIEAKTPFQWFAPTIANHDLIDVSNALSELRIDFKIGAKAEPNKVAFFQLCQRASRDVGEAIVDVLAQLDSASWGGVPRDMRDRLDVALAARGFANGFSDCFDERFEHDLFGWEFIDTGVSDSLLWSAYEAMREFAEQTDSRTYDETYDSEYHGNEWIQRCDERCMGRACGACSGEDLKLRAAYIAEKDQDEDIDLSVIRPVDQSTVAFKIRAQLVVPERYRFVEAPHWRYAIRRAAYQAPYLLADTGVDYGSIAKHSVHLASERLNYKDWSCGADYAEWGMTRRLKQANLTAFIDEMARVLHPWLKMDGWNIFPAVSRMTASADLSLYELELPVSADQATSWLQRWDDAGSVRLLLRALHAGYFQAATEEVNAKDYASDLWLARDGSRLMLKMLLRDRAGPYQVYAALSGKASWIEAAAAPAVRLGAFTRTDSSQGGDLLRPSCAACGQLIPVSLLDEPWGTEFCPRHEDEDAGRLVSGLRELQCD